MKRKLLAILTLVVMLFSTMAFTACESGPATGNSGDLGGTEDIIPDPGKDLTEIPEGGYDGSAVTIRFYHTMGKNLSTVLEKYIGEFNKIYPNIKIAHEQVGSYDDVKSQISTQISEGLQPHVAYCYPDHVATYNISGAVQTLDILINDPDLGLTEEQIADFIPGYYEEGREFGDGLMYTMPFSKSTEVLYYNKTFFDKHGLTPPKTWAELRTLCERLIEIDPNCIPLGYDSEANWFITMCEQLGTTYTSATGNKYVFDTPENRAFVAEFCDWYYNGLVTTQEILKAYTSTLFTSTDEVKSYMSIGSSAGATHQRPEKVEGKYPFEVGIASIPQVVDPATNPDYQPKVISQGPSVCIFKKTNPQETIASWLFVKYLTTSVAFQADFSIASGYVPVIKSVDTDEAYIEHLAAADGTDGIAALSSKVCLEQADYYYTSPAFNGSSLARERVGALIQNCFIACTTGVDTDAIANEFIAAVRYCESMAPSKK